VSTGSHGRRLFQPRVATANRCFLGARTTTGRSRRGVGPRDRDSHRVGQRGADVQDPVQATRLNVHSTGRPVATIRSGVRYVSHRRWPRPEPQSPPSRRPRPWSGRPQSDAGALTVAQIAPAMTLSHCRGEQTTSHCRGGQPRTRAKPRRHGWLVNRISTNITPSPDECQPCHYRGELRAGGLARDVTAQVQRPPHRHADPSSAVRGSSANVRRSPPRPPGVPHW
jgi:hypothetical protein